MIEPAAAPVVMLAAHTVSVEPGSEAALELQVRNLGSVVDAYQLEVLGPAAAWTTVEPSTLRLFPETGDKAVARFRPPRAWTTSAGILTVGFRVVSSVDPGSSSVEECELEIQPFSEVTAELRPRTSRGRVTGRHRLHLHNASNEPAKVTLSARDVDGDCAVEVRPERITIPPGRDRRATVRVKPSYRPMIGPAMENYSFETSVRPAGGIESKLQGSMRQTAMLPRGTVMLAGLGVVALIGFGIYSRMGPILINPTNTVTTPSPIVASPTPTPTAANPSPSASTAATATPGTTATPAGSTSGTGGGGARSGAWSTIRPMGTAREQHTATVLADGRLLVAGGLQVSGTSVSVLSSTELYDPASGAWTPGAQLGAGRADHTATALADGRVLVVGGETQSGAALASAELYDPVANRWSSAGALRTARFGHAAVLLNGGRVLVAGGRTSTGGTSAPLATTEIYDPATGTWSTGPNLSVARSDLTATLLADARVLVAGGDAAPSSAASSPQAVADLVDPDGRTATRAANMGTTRADHTATLLPDGRVLIVGGTLGTPRAEVFAPGTGRWTATAAPAAARRYHAAAMLASGKVLVAGGAGTAALASAETFDPSTNVWSGAPALSGPRWQPVMAALKNGQVIVTGGVPVLAKTTPPLASAEVFG